MLSQVDEKGEFEQDAKDQKQTDSGTESTSKS
jgi:hypothetical protein